MKVKALIGTKGREVVSTESSNSVEDAIRSMHTRRISALVVTEQGRPVGIFTERDVVRTYIATGGTSFSEVSLREAMTRDLIVVELEDDSSAIMSVMVERNIRHLPVVHEGALIGMLSIRDVIQAQVQNLTAEIHYLKDYISQA